MSDSSPQFTGDGLGGNTTIFRSQILFILVILFEGVVNSLTGVEIGVQSNIEIGVGIFNSGERCNDGSVCVVNLFSLISIHQTNHTTIADKHTDHTATIIVKNVKAQRARSHGDT